MYYLAENEMEKIKQENEAVRQETTELSATNDLLREQADGLIENREKLMSDNKALEQRQKKLQQDIEKMADSKVTLERNIHAYDKDAKWQFVGFIRPAIKRNSVVLPAPFCPTRPYTSPLETEKSTSCNISA
ncbi:hypothetical protein C809_00392 [Lachnospiraceae bacterium MD335]|nr:hypothetical protein C809_00392 [Lachnospiraceae bacterium MD335]